MWNDQRRIHFEITNPYVREREIHVFLKLETNDLHDLTTATYELFFTGSALALTNRSTGKKIVFQINEEPRVSNTDVKHGNTELVRAIGIAAYFKTCPRP